jgi:hypothetical protein
VELVTITVITFLEELACVRPLIERAGVKGYGFSETICKLVQQEGESRVGRHGGIGTDWIEVFGTVWDRGVVTTGMGLTTTAGPLSVTCGT